MGVCICAHGPGQVRLGPPAVGEGSLRSACSRNSCSRNGRQDGRRMILSFARQTKIWFPKRPFRKSRKILALPREEFSRAIRWMTGQAFLRLWTTTPTTGGAAGDARHLHIRGRAINPLLTYLHLLLAFILSLAARLISILHAHSIKSRDCITSYTTRRATAR